jgi:hypothetical protein
LHASELKTYLWLRCGCQPLPTLLSNTAHAASQAQHQLSRSFAACITLLLLTDVHCRVVSAADDYCCCCTVVFHYQCCAGSTETPIHWGWQSLPSSDPYVTLTQGDGWWVQV